MTEANVQQILDQVQTVINSFAMNVTRVYNLAEEIYFYGVEDLEERALWKGILKSLSAHMRGELSQDATKQALRDIIALWNEPIIG